jgi:15-cis-phytoene synthase
MDHAACRALIRQGSKSFFAASLLLPARIREASLALYAFCRSADDLVDVQRSCTVLPTLTARLARVYAGVSADSPADRAFSEVVHRYAIPRALPEALLEGFRWDFEGRCYQSLGDVLAYSARVAGSVGAMMSCLMNARDPDVVARACELGVAMQLTNIARDVGEDARAGRLYLPLDWLGEVGINPSSWLSRPVWSPQLSAVVARLLDVADGLYLRASGGIGRLPRGCRVGIWAARLLYAEIGQQVRRHGYDSVNARAVVAPARKAALLGRALLAAPHARPAGARRECLGETRFLVDAVCSQREPHAAAPEAQSLRTPLERLVLLFERLEQRDRAAGLRGT